MCRDGDVINDKSAEIIQFQSKRLMSYEMQLGVVGCTE